MDRKWVDGGRLWGEQMYRMSCSSARCRSFDRMPLTPLVRTHTPLIGGVCSTNGLRYPRQKAAVGVGLYIHGKNFFYSNFGAKVQLFLGILNSIDHKMHPMRNFVAKGGALALAFGYKKKRRNTVCVLRLRLRELG